MEFKTFTAQDTTGRVLPAATANVYTAGTTSPATVYDENGVAFSQPLTASGSGGFGFEAVNGVYDVAITSGVETQTIQNVLFYDPNNIQDSRFVDRASLVAGWAEDSVADGVLVSDGTVFYIAESGLTVISDLPGLRPFVPGGWCYCQPEHFGENTSPASTNMTAAIQAAIDYCEANGTGTFGQGAAVGFSATRYLVSDTDADGYALTITSSVTLRGQGSNSSAIFINTPTVVTVYIGKGDTAILADTTNVQQVRGVKIENLQFYQTSATTSPTAGCHIRVDRSIAHIESCELVNHHKGIEFLGNPESCRVTNCDITQSSTRAVLNFDAQSAGFTAGETVTGGTSGASGTIYSVTSDGTTGHLELSSMSAALFEDNETITSAGGSATANGVLTGKTGSCGIFIERRQVNENLPGDVYEDSTDSLFYVEPNSVFIDNCNLRMGASDHQYGGAYAVRVGACDGLYITNSHLAWGYIAAVGLIPSQANMSFTDVRIVGGLIDPKPNKSLYGVLLEDVGAVGTLTIGSISISDCSIAGTVLDGVRVTADARRFRLDNVDIKGCGRYGLIVNDANIKNFSMTDCGLFNTNTAGGTAAMAYVGGCDRVTIADCSFDTGYRGIQLTTSCDRVSITGNVFDGMTNSISIFVPSGLTGEVTIANNDIEESATLTSASRLHVPAGLERIHITGTTNINEIRQDLGGAGYSGQRVLATFAGALDLVDDATAPGGAVVPNLRIGADFTTATGTVVELVYAPDVEAGKYIVASTRANA